MLPTVKSVPSERPFLGSRIVLFFLIALGFALPPSALAQVIYTGSTVAQNFGSQAIGSTSTATAFSFSIAAGTTVGSIGVLTQGAPNLDFVNATGSTCTATTYSSTTTCAVNVTFAPKAAGLRMGAVVFFAEARNQGTALGNVLIRGTGTGPQIAYGPGTGTLLDPTVVATDSSSPEDVAVDGFGNVYFSDWSGYYEVPAGRGAVIVINPTVDGQPLGTSADPCGLTVDGAGDLFIPNGNRVVELPVGGGAPTAITPMVNGSSLYSCVIAVDGSGDLFLGGGGNSVTELPVGGGTPIVIAPMVDGEALSGVQGVAVDAEGNLYISDGGNFRVVEVPASGPPTVVFSIGGFVFNLAVDGVGNLYIADVGVTEVPVGGGPWIDLSNLPNFYCAWCQGVAVDAFGNVFITDFGLGIGDGKVLELQRSQPPALNFPTVTNVGSIDTTDGTQTVQIMNIGNAALTLTALSYPADFPEASGDSSACTGTTSLSVGEQCDLPVEFAPRNGGALSESVTLTDNALNVTGAQQSIGVTGTGNVAEALTSPTPGSTLGVSNITFTWTPGTGATEFELWLGLSGPGSSSLYNSGVTTATSVTANSLPTRGATIYARLFYEVAGVWQHLDYTYTEATAVLATLTSPTAGSTLAPSNVAFTWTLGLGVVNYNLWLGVSGVGSSDLSNSGIVTTTSTTVPTLPAKGATVYARLFSNVGGEWEWTDSTYIESTAVLATITSPTPGATLGTSNISFTWTAGLGVQKYNLWLGTSGVGSSNLYNSGIVTTTSVTVSALPAKGATVYARLFSDVGGTWRFTDVTYVEQ